MDEAQLRDRFFDSAFAVLTPEQRNVLVDPSYRGRIALDLFSSGLVWQGKASRITFVDVDGLVAGLAQRLPAQIEVTLTDAQMDELRRLVAEWLREWPADALSAEADALSLAGMSDTRQVTAVAQREVALLERFGPTMGLDDAGVRRVRAFALVLVPLRVRSGL